MSDAIVPPRRERPFRRKPAGTCPRVSHRRGARCQCGDTTQRGNVTMPVPAPPPHPRTDSDWLAGAFEAHREHLRAVAYRLLGSMSDADDAVQDTWLRLTSADASEVENLGGWLTTVVARVSLNMLRSRRHRPAQPVGDSWPASVEASAGDGAAAAPRAPAPLG